MTEKKDLFNTVKAPVQRKAVRKPVSAASGAGKAHRSKVIRSAKTGRVIAVRRSAKGLYPVLRARALTPKEQKAATRKARLKKLRDIFWTLTALTVIVLGFDRYVMPMVQPASPSDLTGPCKVVSVSDGDTFSAQVEGETRTIRLIGVDTPESVHPDKDKNVPQGKIASDYTKDLLSGRSVWLEQDAESEDRYGRLLCYVYLDKEGTDMVQERLLKDGMACVMTIQPNSRYADRFVKLQQTARKEGKGFWAEGLFE